MAGDQKKIKIRHIREVTKAMDQQADQIHSMKLAHPDKGKEPLTLRIMRVKNVNTQQPQGPLGLIKDVFPFKIQPLKNCDEQITIDGYITVPKDHPDIGKITPENLAHYLTPANLRYEDTPNLELTDGRIMLLPPPSLVENVKKFVEQNARRRDRATHVLKIYCLSPFLYGKPYHPHDWLQYAVDMGMLPSGRAGKVEKLDRVSLDKVQMIEDACDEVFPNLWDTRRAEEVVELMFGLNAGHKLANLLSFAMKDPIVKKWRRNVVGEEKSVVFSLLWVAHFSYITIKDVDGKYWDLVAGFEAHCQEGSGKASTMQESGNAAYKEKNYKLAKEKYSEGLFRNHFNHKLYGNRAQVHLELGDFESAVSDAKRAVVLKPDFTKGWYRYAEAWSRQGDIHCALKENERGRERCGNDTVLVKQRSALESLLHKDSHPNSTAPARQPVKKKVPTVVQAPPPSDEDDSLPGLVTSSEDEHDDDDDEPDWGKMKIKNDEEGRIVVEHVGYNYRAKREKAKLEEKKKHGEKTKKRGKKTKHEEKAPGITEWECVIKNCRAILQTDNGMVTRPIRHRHPPTFDDLYLDTDEDDDEDEYDEDDEDDTKPDFGKAKIVMNNNGHTILLHAGYNYRVKREGETSNSVEWECVLKKCKATVQTLYGKITKTSEHNHSSENRKEATGEDATDRKSLHAESKLLNNLPSSITSGAAQIKPKDKNVKKLQLKTSVKERVSSQLSSASVDDCESPPARRDPTPDHAEKKCLSKSVSNDKKSGSPCEDITKHIINKAEKPATAGVTTKRSFTGDTAKIDPAKVSSGSANPGIKQSRTGKSTASTKGKKPGDGAKCKSETDSQSSKSRSTSISSDNEPAAEKVAPPNGKLTKAQKRSVKQGHKLELVADLQSGSQCLLRNDYTGAIPHYKSALSSYTERNLQYYDREEVDLVILLYSLGVACVETCIIHEMESGIQQFTVIIEEHQRVVFPLAYLGLGRAYYKQQKFTIAEGKLRAGLKQLNTHPESQYGVRRWPESNIIIEETKPGQLLDNIKQLLRLCSYPPTADAVCRAVDAPNNHKSFIYYGDPDFQGLVRVFCIAKCVVVLHFDCWKRYKTHSGHSDKDVLNGLCLTPDCSGEIWKISFYHSDGTSKFQERKVAKPVKPRGRVLKTLPSSLYTIKRRAEKKRLRREAKAERRRQETVATPSPIKESRALRSHNEPANVQQTTHLTKLTKDIDEDNSELYKASGKNAKNKSKKKKKVQKTLLVGGLLPTPYDQDGPGTERTRNDSVSSLTEQMNIVHIPVVSKMPAPSTQTKPRGSKSKPKKAWDVPLANQPGLQNVVDVITEQEKSNSISEIIYSLFQGLLQEKGPLLVYDPAITDEVDNFPGEARDLITAAGGIGSFLTQSLQFAMADDYLCVVQDAVKARALSLKSRKQNKSGAHGLAPSLSSSNFPSVFEASVNSQTQGWQTVGKGKGRNTEDLTPAKIKPDKYIEHVPPKVKANIKKADDQPVKIKPLKKAQAPPEPKVSITEEVAPKTKKNNKNKSKVRLEDKNVPQTSASTNTVSSQSDCPPSSGTIPAFSDIRDIFRRDMDLGAAASLLVGRGFKAAESSSQCSSQVSETRCSVTSDQDPRERVVSWLQTATDALPPSQGSRGTPSVDEAHSSMHTPSQDDQDEDEADDEAEDEDLDEEYESDNLEDNIEGYNANNDQSNIAGGLKEQADTSNQQNNPDNSHLFNKQSVLNWDSIANTSSINQLKPINNNIINTSLSSTLPLKSTQALPSLKSTFSVLPMNQSNLSDKFGVNDRGVTPGVLPGVTPGGAPGKTPGGTAGVAADRHGLIADSLPHYNVTDSSSLSSHLGAIGSPLRQPIRTHPGAIGDRSPSCRVSDLSGEDLGLHGSSPDRPPNTFLGSPDDLVKVPLPHPDDLVKVPLSHPDPGISLLSNSPYGSTGDNRSPTVGNGKGSIIPNTQLPYVGASPDTRAPSAGNMWNMRTEVQSVFKDFWSNPSIGVEKMGIGDEATITQDDSQNLPHPDQHIGTYCEDSAAGAWPSDLTSAARGQPNQPGDLERGAADKCDTDSSTYNAWGFSSMDNINDDSDFTCFTAGLHKNVSAPPGLDKSSSRLDTFPSSGLPNLLDNVWPDPPSVTRQDSPSISRQDKQGLLGSPVVEPEESTDDLVLRHLQETDDEFMRDVATSVFKNLTQHEAFKSNPYLMQNILSDIKRDIHGAEKSALPAEKLTKPLGEDASVQTLTPVVCDSTVNTDPYEPYKQCFLEAEKERQSLQRAVDQLRQEQADVRAASTTESKLLKRQMAEAQQHIEKLRGQLEKEKTDNLQRMTRLKQEKCTAEDRLSSVRQQLQTTKTSEAEMKTKVAELQKDVQEVEPLREQKDQLENELKTKQDVIGRLQSRWATQATRAEYAEVALIQLRRDIGMENLTQERKKLEQLTKSLSDHIKQLQKDKQPVSVMLERQLEHLKKIVSQIQEQETNLTQFDEQIKLLRSGRELASLPILSVPKPPPRNDHFMRACMRPMGPGGELSGSAAVAPRTSDNQPARVPETQSAPVRPAPGFPPQKAAGAKLGHLSTNQQQQPTRAKNSYTKIMDNLTKSFPKMAATEINKYIQALRQTRQNSLSGMMVQEIVQRVSELILQDQAKKHSESVNAWSHVSASAQQAGSSSGGNSRSSTPGSGSATAAAVTEVFQEEEDPCIICHDELTPLTTTQLDCQHRYHTECIKKWLVEQSTCPTCRVHTLLTEDFPSL